MPVTDAVAACPLPSYVIGLAAKLTDTVGVAGLILAVVVAVVFLPEQPTSALPTLPVTEEVVVFAWSLPSYAFSAAAIVAVAGFGLILAVVVAVVLAPSV